MTGGPRELTAKPLSSWGSKVAGAPISWGVSELPGWGYRMLPGRVLAEMKEAGLDATELGPPGYLPSDPVGCRDLLARHGLRLVAGFLATVLHEPREGSLTDVDREVRMLAALGAETLVLAAALPGESYDRHEELSPRAWNALGETLSAAQDIAAAHGLGLAFHPHVGTAVESHQDVENVLAMTGVNLCLDTGHLFLGGTDPVRLATAAGARVSHVHLKDVDIGLAARVRAGDMSYAEAVRAGLYRPLGQGGLDIEAVIGRLQDAGYQGWYVLEQDTALIAEPELACGPAAAVRQSLQYFQLISSAKPATKTSKED